MMLATTNEIEIFEVIIKSLSREFHFPTQVTKVHRGVILTLDAPR